MSVIEDLLAEGMAERVAAVSVPPALPASVWRRFRRRRARRRAVGLLAAVLTLVGLGALIPGLVATHGDPAQTASEPQGSPAPAALKAQLMAALSNDEASIERETVTGATGSSGPLQYWYDPVTGQSLVQALDHSGQRVLAQIAALEAKEGGQPLTVTEMDFVTRTWATATVSAATPVPVPMVIPVPVASLPSGFAPPAAGAPGTGTSAASTPGASTSAASTSAAGTSGSGALSAGTPPLAGAAVSVATPADLQRTLQSGTVLVLGHEVIDGQDTVHLAVAPAKLLPTPSGAPSPMAGAPAYQLWVDTVTGQPVQQVFTLDGGRVQTVYSWLAPGQVDLGSLAQVPTGFTEVATAPVALPGGEPAPSPA